MLSEDDHNDILALLGLHPHIDHAHDVVSGADSGGNTVDIDRHIPAFSRQGYPLHELLAVHELTEQERMKDEGEGYKSAHLAATEAEKKAAEKLGVPWAKYEETINGYLSHVEREKEENPPRNALHVSPRAAVNS